MKNKIKTLSVLTLVLMLQISCTIQKRHYMKGYHVYSRGNVPTKTTKYQNKNIKTNATDYTDLKLRKVQEIPMVNEPDLYVSVEDEINSYNIANKTNIVKESNISLLKNNTAQKSIIKPDFSTKSQNINSKSKIYLAAAKTDQKDDSIVWQIIFLALTLFGVIKMSFEIGKRPYKELTIDEIRAERKLKDLPEESTDEESEAAWNTMLTSTQSWYTYTDENGDEFIKPYKKKHLKETSEILKSVQGMLPTDPEVLARLNEVGYFANSMAKRRFSGSLPLIIVACAALLFLTLIIGGPFFPALFSSWWLIASIVFYVFASRAPQYLIDKRLEKYSGRNITSSFIAGFLSIFTSTPSTETVEYTYTSGRKEVVEELNWGKVFLFIIIGVVFLIMGMAIHAFGLLNFLRNYVFYF